MITLDEFMKLYSPEFVSDKVFIFFYTKVKCGNITTTTKLGSYQIDGGKSKELEMDRMIVEKFTIPNRTKMEDGMIKMEIVVSDNRTMNTRGKSVK